MAKARKTDTVSFQCSAKDREFCRKIARRAHTYLVSLFSEGGVGRSVMDIEMDVVATHCNGNPLRLADLLAADDFNFMHDVGGIARHLDRETGSLMDYFSPRFTARQKVAA